MDENALEHHGIKGMRWGIRRYQNSDGSLTAAGKKHRGESSSESSSSSSSKTASSSKGKSSSSGTKKSVSEMSNEELRTAINRLQLEKQYKELTPATVSKGQKFAKTVMKKVVEPAVTEASKQILKDAIIDAAKKKTK